MNDKNNSLHGSKFGVPFFAVAEVTMAVPNKRYYIEKLQILM